MMKVCLQEETIKVAPHSKIIWGYCINDPKLSGHTEG